MRLEQVNLPGDILLVKLAGPLDIAGAGEIDMPFSVISGKYSKVIVNLADVSFLASIGIRVLVKAARTIGNKKGTGGSLGVEFLKQSLFKPIFPDLWAIRHEL